MIIDALRGKDMELDEEYGSVKEGLGKTEALELIREPVTLSSSWVLRNDREVWFQLYGRLVGSSEEDEIREYLIKARQYAEKPWIRCAHGLLKQAGGVVERSWNM